MFNLSPIPPSKHTILLFISQLGLDGLSLSTMKSYMSAIRNLLINAGFSSYQLYTPKVELVLRCIKFSKGPLAQPHLPITPSILLQLKQV